MNPLLFLLETVNTKVNPNTTSSVADAAGKAIASTGRGTTMNPAMLIILYCVVIFGALYFFSIRPQKKREKALEEMRGKIQAGSPVLLSNGMYGTIVDITAECFIVEFGTNKGVRIPVLKQEVVSVKEPNLSNKVVEEPEPEKKSLFGGKKNKDEKTE